VNVSKLSGDRYPPTNMAMEELRAFVQESRWKFAKSMPQTPHEYTLRREAKNEALFERMVIHIRQVGYHRKWGKTSYTYLDIDGWQYWTMGAPLGPTGTYAQTDTTLMNRTKLKCSNAECGQGDGDHYHCPEHGTHKEWHCPGCRTQLSLFS